jgi:hypothetical protein
MTEYVLRVVLDGIAAKERVELPAANRFIYLREGDAIARANGVAASLSAGSGTTSAAGITIEGGQHGATLLRWELVRDGVAACAGEASRELRADRIELTDPQGYLLRADRVDFPLGGIAYTHTHRGPGIRCLLRGEIRVDAAGESHRVRSGEAWFESGPDAVLATASIVELTSFARVMILPRELIGKSSIRYVKPEDVDKPKTQRYQIFADEPIDI